MVKSLLQPADFVRSPFMDTRGKPIGARTGHAGLQAQQPFANIAEEQIGQQHECPQQNR
ncbi:hypothetical protein D3C74_430410 [compost metagenome]